MMVMITLGDDDEEEDDNVGFEVLMKVVLG